MKNCKGELSTDKLSAKKDLLNPLSNHLLFRRIRILIGNFCYVQIVSVQCCRCSLHPAIKYVSFGKSRWKDIPTESSLEPRTCGCLQLVHIS